MAKGGLTDKDKGWKKFFLEAQRYFGHSHVKVGVLASERRDESGLTNAEVALIHEYGAPAANIPERSFLRNTFDKKRRAMEHLAEKLLAKVLEGKLTYPEAMKLLGLQHEADVKLTISAGVPPPLKPQTIARKGSSKPLIDTGQLRASITHQVVMAGEGGGE